MQIPTDTISVIAEYLPTRQDIENISTIFEDIKIVERKKYYNTYKIGHVCLVKGENSDLVKISQFCDSLEIKDEKDVIKCFEEYLTNEVFLKRNFTSVTTIRNFISFRRKPSFFLLLDNILKNRFISVKIEDISRLRDCTSQQRADFLNHCITSEYIQYNVADWISRIDESATESTNLEIWDQFFGDRQFFSFEDDSWVAHGMDLHRLGDLIIDASYSNRIEFFQAFMKTRFVDLVFDLAMRSRKEYHNCSTRVMTNIFELNPEYARLVLQHPRFVVDAEYLVSQDCSEYIDDLYEFDPVLATAIESIERDY